MTIPARLQIAPPATDRRASPRRKLCLGSSLRGSGDEVTIHDLSSSGMLIETAAALAPFDGLEIELPEIGTRAAVIVWNSGRYFGCEFREPLPQAAISAALLRSPAGISADPSPPLPEPTAPYSAGPAGFEGTDADRSIGEEKAPLAVRLRVILGTTIVLWALIIWASVSLIHLVRKAFG
jgi:hypothetical protein